jgi:purine-binding chemotaxis protein CheW
MAEATETQAAAAESPGTRAGKYLTFVLGDEEYGLEILKVREIIGMMEITAVPQTPDFVKGVINLRGKVIPVVDLRLKFGMEEKEVNEATCIIVVEVSGVQMGVVVDTVSEVVDIEESQIEDPPRFGTQVDTDFILGMGKVEKSVKILLEIETVLSSEELVLVSEMAEE